VAGIQGKHLQAGSEGEAQPLDDRRAAEPAAGGCRGKHVPPRIHGVQVRGVALVDVRAALSLPGPVRAGIAGAEFHGGGVRVDELPARRRVLLRQKNIEGDIGEVRVAVPGFPVRERELGDLDQEVDVLRGVVLHRAKVVPFQHGELLEKDRPLGPGAALEDVVPR